MQYIDVIIKTVVLYFYIIIMYRLMGKKEVGKLSIVDLIVSILIAEVAAISIEDDKIPLLLSIVPMTLLLVLQVTISFISLKSSKIRRMLDGKESVIIKDGKINFKEMFKQRYSLDDLMLQLREQEIASLDQVKHAVLEVNGKLSVFKHPADYPFPIILDGNIEKETLKALNKDEKWLLKMLKDKKIELNDVFYCFYTKNKTFIITQNDLVK
ncbi:MAG TPA: DUF421 domain-containing protein [Tenericutes bacterium]|nr:DUF421 domain-containing protein [Mycoplasmatota bacterium]